MNWRKRNLNREIPGPIEGAIRLDEGQVMLPKGTYMIGDRQKLVVPADAIYEVKDGEFVLVREVDTKSPLGS